MGSATHGLVTLGRLDKQAGHTVLLHSFLLASGLVETSSDECMFSVTGGLVVKLWAFKDRGRESAAGKPGWQSWQCRLSPGADQDRFVCDSQPEICNGNRQSPTLQKAFNRVIMCLCSFPLKRARYPFLPPVRLSYLWNQLWSDLTDEPQGGCPLMARQTESLFSYSLPSTVEY